MYPNHKLWALAVSAVITELDGADHYWIGGYGPAEDTKPRCIKLLSDYYGIESREDTWERLKYYFEQGDSAHARSILANLSDTPRKDNAKEKVVRAEAGQIAAHGLIAWDLARAIMVAGRACWADYLSEDEAWSWILPAAAHVQKHFHSWEEFSVNYELGRSFWADGKPHPGTAKIIKYLLSDSESLWIKLPFNTNLGPEKPVAQDQTVKRFKKTVCSGCGAPKSKPSLTAYVYCDYCGSLADYDFQKSKENPAAQPGPVYEALLAELQPELARSKASEDKAAYFAAQEKLFGAWVDACPNAIPPRAKEPKYKKDYVAYMSKMNTVSAFNQKAQEYSDAVNRAVAGLQWTMTPSGGYRVGEEGWENLIKAFFPQQEYLSNLAKSEGIYDQNPDGASEDVQKKIGYSLFVQGWLPMITDEQGQSLLEKTGLTGEYLSVLPVVASHTAGCGQCGAKLEIPEGAKKTVCEYCGFVLNSGRSNLSCPGCQAQLTPVWDGTAFNCPYCATEVRLVK